MREPKLSGMCQVGAVRFSAGVKLSVVQGAIDRLYARYEKLNDVMLQVKELEGRFSPSLRDKIDKALSL